MQEYDALDDLRAAGHAFVDEALRHISRPLDSPVQTRRRPSELAALFGPPPEEGRPWPEMLADLRENVVDQSLRLAHPMYMAQQVAPPLPLPALADALVSMLNQSQAVWEMSPAATPLEHALIRWFAALAGFGEAAAGSFVSGGSAGNLTGLLAARARVFPDAWTHGMPPGALLITGSQAHYSVARAAGILGLGAGNVVAVRTTAQGATDPAAIEAALRDADAAGRTVLAVVATAGSTAMGSFDDLEALADLCGGHGVWLHVDGAHGASALLSREAAHRARLAGLARADSLAWDPHKMMFQPMSTSVVLVREPQWLLGAFRQDAPYLFHREAGGEPPPDMGGYTLQCSRRSDAVRLWIALEHYGTRRLGELYDHTCGLATHLFERLEDAPDFEALHRPESNILCFRWRPSGMEEGEELDRLQDALRGRYIAAGRGFIAATTLAGRRTLRVTLINPRTTTVNVDRMLDGLRAEAAALLAEG